MSIERDTSPPVTSLLAELRSELRAPAPPPEGLIAEIAREAARAPSVPAAKRDRGTGSRGFTLPRLFARVAVPALALPLVVTGLAFAGVTLPAPARDVIDSLGIDLPNQPEENAAAERPGKPSDAGGGAENAPGVTGVRPSASERGKGNKVGHDRRPGKQGPDGRPGKPVGPTGAPGQAGRPQGGRGPNPDPGGPRGLESGRAPANSNAGGGGPAAPPSGGKGTGAGGPGAPKGGGQGAGGPSQ